MPEVLLEKAVGRALRQAGWRLAVAESCTGGFISHRLTNVPGSSGYFEQAVVCYSDASKTGLLKVSPRILVRHGAVSAQVAMAMARGIRKVAGTDLGLAVTGIAGPGGGTAEKPVGLVYVALADRRKTRWEEHRFRGSRLTLKRKFSAAALDLVRRHLQKSS